jgi:hypothetical protein
MALDGRLVAVSVRLPAGAGKVELETPVVLFQTHPPRAVEHIDGPQYVVSPDGKKFLVNTVAEKTNSDTLNLILNWKGQPTVSR